MYNEATTTWHPLEPLVRHTFSKPLTGFEPPASDTLNAMSYVIAFEDDGSAKDVTRRYAQWYNAKTRKSRVESTKGGEAWWAKTMGHFQKPDWLMEVRDEVEEWDLVAKVNAEAMPKNLQDFKGHPVYALERHLRRNEVVWPKRPAGKVGAGSAHQRDVKLESVYRRSDVHVVRSADQWYRRGRDVKVGEQPMKRVVLRKRRDLSYADDDTDAKGTPLYAEFQTDVYVPPEVVRGKVPRNVYGNLDVYVSSMIPAGAVHVRHPAAARAAKTLGVDYADAVTGFDFKGRQGTAVLNGIVTAAEYTAAVVEVVKALEYEQVTMEQEKRSMAALQMWKRFMTALRIRERVDKDYVGREGEETDKEGDGETSDDSYEGEEGGADGGGFLLDRSALPRSDSRDAQRMPDLPRLDLLEETLDQEIVVIPSPHRPKSALVPAVRRQEDKSYAVHSGFEDGGGFVVGDDHGTYEGFVPGQLDDDSGGGFLRGEPGEDAGGGFLRDDIEQGCELAPKNKVDGTAVELRAEDTEGTTISVRRTKAATSGTNSDAQHQEHTHIPTAHTHSADTEATSDTSHGEDLPHIFPGADTKTKQQGLSTDDKLEPVGGPNVVEDPLVSPLQDRPEPDPPDSPASDDELLSEDPEDEDAEPEWLMDQ